MAATWRLAYSLERLRDQINAKAPERSKASDGTIGDAAHMSRSSDHNAWIRTTDAEGRGIGVVSALDITHDPRNGIDAGKLAEALKRSGDRRLKYIISNSRIWNPSIQADWRPYDGDNPHTMHVHISVHSDKSLYDNKDSWEAVNTLGRPDPSAVRVVEKPILRPGMDGMEVDILRENLALALQNEMNFGPLMKGLIKGFQEANKLVADGIVGAYTWEKLKQKGISK